MMFAMAASANPLSSAAETMPAARWSIVVMLAAALFINYVDRGALPTAAHLIQDDLHLSEPQLGWLFSAFSWTYVCCQIPVGWLAERYGAHRLLAAGLTLWAVATILIGTAHTFPALLALRLLLGIGESAGFPCVSKLLAAVVPLQRLGSANGLVAFAYLLGPAVGTYFGGLIMAGFGWRAAFVVFGSLSLLWLLPWLRADLPARAVQPIDSNAPTLGMMLREPSLWGTCLGLFSSNYTFYFMLTWLPFYLVRERGFSTVEMAQLVGSAFVVNAVSALGAGWGIDRWIARGGSTSLIYKSIMAAAHLGSVACMLCMAMGSRPWALGAIYVFQILTGISSPGTYAIPQILAGASATGRWVGIQNSIGNLAGIVAPALTGIIIGAAHHFTEAFLLAAAVSMLGLVGWVWMLPKLTELHWVVPGSGVIAGR
jgi:MFS family permease